MRDDLRRSTVFCDDSGGKVPTAGRQVADASVISQSKYGKHLIRVWLVEIDKSWSSQAAERVFTCDLVCVVPLPFYGTNDTAHTRSMLRPDC